jgi:DNA polymerase-3 subunit alpha
MPASLLSSASRPVRGRIDKREDVPKIIAMEVTQPDLTISDAGGPLSVAMPIGRCTPPVVERLKEVLITHAGSNEVHLHLQNGPRTTVVRLDDKLRVTPSPALMGDLKQLLGPACLMG